MHYRYRQDIECEQVKPVKDKELARIFFRTAAKIGDCETTNDMLLRNVIVNRQKVQCSLKINFQNERSERGNKISMEQMT